MTRGVCWLEESTWSYNDFMRHGWWTFGSHEASMCPGKNVPIALYPLPYRLCLLCMDRVLQVLLNFLRKLRFTRGFIHHFFRRWALLLAFLGRRFGVWHPPNDGKGGAVMFRKTEGAVRSFRGSRTQSDSREGVPAASYVPASASNLRQHHVSNASQQPQPVAAPATSWPATYPPSTRPTAEPHGDVAYPTSSYRTHSHELTPVGQPSQFSRAAYSLLGHGLSASPSSERLSSSPSSRVRSPPLSPSSHAYAPSSPESHPEHRRRRSSTNVVVNTESSSTELPHPSPSTSPLPLMEEPYTIGLSIAPSSSITDAPLLREESLGLSTRASIILSTSDLPSGLPSGFSVKPMNPDQVPRYTKNITVQVDINITTTIMALRLCQIPQSDRRVQHSALANDSSS